LYKRLCGTASPRTFSASSWPHPKLSPFSEPIAARVSATTIRFELVRPPTVCLSAPRGARTRCVRPTSASHCFDYEYPYLVSYRHLSEACASPLADEPALATRRPVNLAFHDARFASAGFVGLTLGFFLRALPKRAVPLTPPSLPILPPSAFAGGVRFGSPRPLPPSLREDETIFTTRGAFHRRGTLTRVRESLPVPCAVT